MGVFTFVCRSSGGDWCAKQLSGDLEASAASTYELQRKLVQLSLSADSSGGVQTSFSLITPSSAVFQVIIGGGAFIGGGASAAAAPAGAASAAEAPPPEEKKAEKEESEDEDMGFSLFD
ncbi:60S acidic ribosomal protein like [Actinidia chinensis var. chinensis]|uniref:60S acidic ribosomal protein like n=1 Tax=Actinidia chinensis var. chinensis TaxID=1590841 RepID=A0A2R6S280_ACTCC|nr:60S acidic ribosomal protein like [Actinidia chinensis var. chinensis]